MSRPVVMRRMQEIAHVEVNCFYASAERIFDPSLEGKPLIVLTDYVPGNIIGLLWPVWLCGLNRDVVGGFGAGQIPRVGYDAFNYARKHCKWHAS
ncbi:hypothetical protein [Arthrobacter sp. NA-172]|uniref:hypothetical protein n=1 Tax=Arthrobacter sp. NA-172 TaxID=3367524 RepID=UPI0037544004